MAEYSTEPQFLELIMAKSIISAAEGYDAVLGYADYLCLKRTILVRITMKAGPAIKVLVVKVDNILGSRLYLIIIIGKTFQNILEQRIAVVLFACDVFQRNRIWGVAEEYLLINVYASTYDYVTQLASVKIYVDACAGQLSVAKVYVVRPFDFVTFAQHLDNGYGLGHR